MRGKTRGFVTSAAGIGAIVAGLVVIDPRVREQAAMLASGRGPTGEFSSVGVRMQELGLVAMQAVRDQSIEHAPLTLFALAALVLFVLMLRT